MMPRREDLERLPFSFFSKKKSGMGAGGGGGEGGGGPTPFTFPQYAGFDAFTEGQYPTAEGVINSYIESGKVLVRPIGYDATVVPDYPVATVYNQTQQLHRQTAPGSAGVEFDLGALAINPSTTTEKLRMELFGTSNYSTRSYFHMRLCDTPWGGGAIQNMVRYYWTWSGGGSWGRILTTTGASEVEEGGLGGAGWGYPYGIPGKVIQVWNVEFDFPNDTFKCRYSGRQNTNIGRTAGAWNSTVETGPANLNASLRYLQLFIYGDGTGTRPQACVHAWTGLGTDAWPDGVEQ